MTGGPDSAVGEQTITTLVRAAESGGLPPRDVVGVITPIPEAAAAVLQARFDSGGMCTERVSFSEHFEWLAWMEPPQMLDDVQLFRAPSSRRGEACFDLPILQSHVDTIMAAALCHGEAFAAEWLDVTEGWSSFWLNDRLESRRPWVHQPRARQIDRLLKAHPPGPHNTFSWRSHESVYPTRRVDALVFMEAAAARRRGAIPAVLGEEADEADPEGSASSAAAAEAAVEASRTPRLQARNFLFGFGSIINTASRRQSDPEAVDAAPCRIKREWGYIREWNFRTSAARLPSSRPSPVRLPLARPPACLIKPHQASSSLIKPVPPFVVRALPLQKRQRRRSVH